MTKTATSPYDVAEHLRTREDMAAYLEASIEEADGDAAFVAKALGDIARARGMAQVASEPGRDDYRGRHTRRFACGRKRTGAAQNDSSPPSPPGARQAPSMAQVLAKRLDLPRNGGE